MSNFNLGKYIAQRIRFKVQSLTIESIDFDLMPLTDDLIAKVKSCETYDDMVLGAADYGVASEGGRICDDDEAAMYLGEAWISPEMTVECKPSLKLQVGLAVCEISGLTDVLIDQLAKEELAAEVEAERVAAEAVDKMQDEANDIQVGDHLLPSDITIGELNDDAETHLNPL